MFLNGTSFDFLMKGEFYNENKQKLSFKKRLLKDKSQQSILKQYF